MRENRGGHLSSTQNEERLALYKRGLTDRVIGEAQGVTHYAIGDWRRRRDLPPNDSPYRQFCYGNAAKKALQRERATLIAKGWSDAAIALHQRRDPATIRYYRLYHGLPLAMGTLDDKPMIVSYEASYAERHIADPSWSNWLEEMGATVW